MPRPKTTPEPQKPAGRGRRAAAAPPAPEPEIQAAPPSPTADELAYLEVLKAAIEDTQNLLKLKPPLTTEGTQEDLIKQLTESVAIFEAVDKGRITPETEAVYTELGLVLPWLAPGAECPPDTDAAKAAAKAAAKEAEKAAKAAAKEAEKAAKAAAKKDQPPRYTRKDAFADAARAAGTKGMTLEVLAKTANDLYIKSGGKDNIKEAQWTQGHVLDALLNLGYAEVKDKVFRLVK